MLFTGNGSVEFFINLSVAGINAAVADHFVMLFRDMANEAFYELHNRKSLFHIGIIFVTVVMEGDKVTIIAVNSGRGDNRPPQIASHVFYGGFGVTFIRLCIDIETIFVFPVAARLSLFERRADFGFHFTQQSSAESIAEVGIVEVIDDAPETVITVAAFRNQAVDMGVPFQIPAKGVEDQDETGSKVHGLIPLKEHTRNNTVYGMEETIKQGAVIQEEIAELFINGKNTVTVGDIDKLKGHGGSALHGVEISTGRAKTAVAAEGDEFKLSAMRAAEHCPTKGGISTVNHFFYVFNNRVTGM